MIWETGYASPLDLFLKMEKITPKLVEEWRFGRIPYLERVLSLGQLSFIMKEFRKMVKEMDLKESYTTYMSWGKGTKRPLRFSKSGDSQVECHYSTRYIKPREVEKVKLKPADGKLTQPED